MNSQEKQNHSLKNLSDCIKILAADAVEVAKSGHPGMPLGFAQVMTLLAIEFLQFNPHDPKWFNRDRLVLSAGHGSMLLYSFFYLAGYKGFELEDIKNFRQLNSKAAGHPEHELFEAIETTTGPLGQGLATAVGMAIAEKKYKAELGPDICNHKIYSIVGDGCLMEGIAYEAASLAGHLQLNNLIILFDDNNITIDGSTDLSVSEDHLQKFAAMGFNTVSIDGYDCDQIRQALADAQDSDKPSFIACKTLIGKGANAKEGSEKSHGSPLGAAEIQHLKRSIKFFGEEFFVADDLKKLWEKAWEKSLSAYEAWQENYRSLPMARKSYLEYPDIKDMDLLPQLSEPEATRVSSGKMIELLMKSTNKIICGSADLAGSNGMNNSECKSISSKDFSGNFIHYGVRENAMAAVMNGLALSGFLTIGGTFFVFSDYMRPSVRLSALMGLPIIYVMTHDSIGVGEDGPTHQPIEHLASFRAMPNINVFRPADFTEMKECYTIALANKNTPSMMVLSRQAVPQIRQSGQDNLSSKGGYVISEANNMDNIDVTIFATGSEVSLAIEVQEELEKYNKSVRVCSVPSTDLLHKQGKEYLLGLKNDARTVVAIEAASSFGWHQIIGCDGIFFGMDSFGASAPASELYKHFNLTKEKISTNILNTL
ncbi:MAG: transketolase [Rickettsiaceae bacterium]|nr:transketolase [Rickettsiaceae bacterium]